MAKTCCCQYLAHRHQLHNCIPFEFDLGYMTKNQTYKLKCRYITILIVATRVQYQKLILHWSQGSHALEK